MDPVKPVATASGPVLTHDGLASDAPAPSPRSNDTFAPLPRVNRAQPLTAVACMTPEAMFSAVRARNMRPFERSRLPAPELFRTAPQVIHPGNPAYGTLTTVRIQHMRPENDAEAATAALISEVGTLGYLQTQAPKHVFAEGVHDGSLGGDTTRITAQVRALYRTWQPGQLPDERQLSAMAKLGAARIYALLHDDVRLHAVATQSESDEDDAYTDRCFNSGTMPSPEVVFDRREERIITRLADFYRAHPGENAVVVFGAHHDFARHVSQEFNPRVIEVALTP